jgi:hemerythrin-like metal-binding protein
MSNEDQVFFRWSPAYSVNIKTIDDQHLELVHILNHLFAAVSKREGDKVIKEILDALVSYTRKHFSLEENLMQRANYKDIVSHMAEHKKLIDQLNQYSNKLMLDGNPIHIEMLGFLKTWLKEHIQGVDTKYSAALRQAGFSAAAWEAEATAEFTRMSNSNRWRELGK